MVGVPAEQTAGLAGRRKLLDIAADQVGSRAFTHTTVGMLTAGKGLNLEQKQQVPLRVALDSSGGSSSSSWGSQAVNQCAL